MSIFYLIVSKLTSPTNLSKYDAEVRNAFTVPCVKHVRDEKVDKTNLRFWNGTRQAIKLRHNHW